MSDRDQKRPPKKENPHLVRVEDDVDEFLRDQAYERRVSVAFIIREAIQEYMKRIRGSNR